MNETKTAIRCKMCNTVLISKHRHDFQQCNCQNRTFVDGGSDYLRYGGADINYIEILNDYED